MPTYNASRHVGAALESVLNQTEGDFEFLIYDDGSTDETSDILRRYEDKRIQLFRSKENLGYVHWLNAGLEESQGQFIARMDADDLCDARRFEKQVEAMQAEPRRVMLGSAVRWIDASGGIIGGKEYPTSLAAILWELCFDNPFCHPTVMMRREVLQSHGLRYREDLLPSEDYELWTRLVRCGEVINLQDSLLDYRIHEGQISQTKRRQQLLHHDVVVKNHLKRYFGETLNFDEQDCVALRKLWQGALWNELDDEIALERVETCLRVLYGTLTDNLGYDVVRREVLPRLKKLWLRLVAKEPAGWNKFRLWRVSRRITSL